MCSKFAIHIVPDKLAKEHRESLDVVASEEDKACTPIVSVPFSNVFGLSSIDASKDNVGGIWLRVLPSSRDGKSSPAPPWHSLSEGRLEKGRQTISVNIGRFTGSLMALSSPGDTKLLMEVVPLDPF